MLGVLRKLEMVCCDCYNFYSNWFNCVLLNVFVLFIPQILVGRRNGRGPLEGLTAVTKRIKSGSQKLEIQFSARLGGPIGLNYRTFVDEVVMFTRRKGPLIGVRSWKDINQDVKNSIAADILVCGLIFPLTI